MNEEELMLCEEEDTVETADTEPTEDAAEETVSEAEIPVQRDFAGESRELAEKFPELLGKALPDEVVMAAAKGVPLTEAYEAFRDASGREENRRGDVERQNENAASRAPVLGVSGGAAVRARGEDDFLRGFNAED